MDSQQLEAFVNKQWDESVIPTLSQFITIPNLSPEFDEKYAENGLQEQAALLLIEWVKSQDIPGASVELIQSKGRTPLILVDIAPTLPPTSDDRSIFMYGHFDKQPPLDGWDSELGPYKPVIREKDGEPWLYGRGGADDGYAIFAACTAVSAIKKQQVLHPRIFIVIEGSEESGSPDLPFYIEQLNQRLGKVDFVVCLDSGAGTYNELWLTSSLRGLITVQLTVSLLKEGVHSGKSGVVPDNFLVLRNLLNRLEDVESGKILLKECYCQIPEHRIKEATESAKRLGRVIVDELPTHQGVQPMSQEIVELLLNQSWRPTLTVIGASGFPQLSFAGNVLRPQSTLKLSIRLPPRTNGAVAAEALKQLMEKDPPFGAQVTLSIIDVATGWDAPKLESWLEESVQKASQTFYKRDACVNHGGGSIPFMTFLGDRYPTAQFFITGVLGPNNNAHGPNEGLNIPYAKKLNCCISTVLRDYSNQIDLLGK